VTKKGSKHSDEKSNDDKQAMKENSDKKKAVFLFIRVVNSTK